jgi:biotin carboxylase
MKRYSILILGASTMQIPAIEAAKRMGWRVLAADRNRLSPGARACDEFLPVDIADRHAVLAEAEARSRRERIDGVFTAGTDFSATVAFVAERLGLPGLPYEVALDASDKARMRGVFEREGLSSPRFRSIGADDDPAQVLEELRLPLVVKPVDNMGSRGVRRVDTPEELETAVSIARGYSRSGSVIVEAYIAGPEFSLDALVYRGEITLCGIADRHIRFPPYFVEIGHTMPSNEPDRIRNEVIDLFFRGIRALRIDMGAAKGDVKYGTDGPVIGEIAARLSGGYMSGWTYPLASGVDVTRGGLRIAVGLPPGDLEPRLPNTAAERAFYSIPGTVASIPGFPEECRSPLSAAFLRVAPGDRVDFPQNNVEKCGNIIAVSPDRDGAIAAAEHACARTVVRLEPGGEATRAFLFGATHRWVPDAFRLECEANHAMLAGMPATVDGDPLSGCDLSIVPLPEIDREASTDWQDRSFPTAVALVTELAGVTTGSSARLSLGSIFWRAFLRGGVQAGVWVIDTFRAGKWEDAWCSFDLAGATS